MCPKCADAAVPIPSLLGSARASENGGGAKADAAGRNAPMSTSAELRPQKLHTAHKEHPRTPSAHQDISSPEM